MSEVVVTRNHQMTLTKDVREKLDIREGDRIIINVVGDSAIISKRDPAAFREAGSFLPDDYEETLSQLRGDPKERLRRLGLV